VTTLRRRERKEERTTKSGSYRATPVRSRELFRSNLAARMKMSVTNPRILAGQLFDTYLLKLVPDQLITISRETGLILDVNTFTASAVPQIILDYPDVIDLRHLTVVPGFVDAHVHCKLSNQDSVQMA
jgi:imidazolonepropionase-like amidohydrolase